MKLRFLFLAAWLGLSIAPCLADSAIFNRVRIEAEKGNATAQGSLGRMYLEGADWEGTKVPKDYVEAYKWLLLAVERGNADKSAGDFDLVRTYMTPQQIEEGDRRFAEWQRAHKK